MQGIFQFMSLPSPGQYTFSAVLFWTQSLELMREILVAIKYEIIKDVLETS